MSRTKYIMDAPAGGEGEAVIQGTYYWPEKNDDGAYVIEVTNPDHLPILSRHGFVQIATISMAPPPTSAGLIDWEELGKTQLEAALIERSVTYDRDGGRSAMEEAAIAWNQARRGRLQRAQEVAEETPVKKAPVPVENLPLLAELDEESIKAVAWNDLKAILENEGVPFNPAVPLVTLRRIAMAELARRKAKAA